MIYGSGNRIFNFNKRFGERKINSLTLTIDDTGFPISNSTSTSEGSFGVSSPNPIKITLNTGDESFYFESTQTYSNTGTYFLTITSDGNPINGFNTNAAPDESEGVYKNVDFQNSIGAQKTITLDFENLSDITFIYLGTFNMYGAIPEEIKVATNLYGFQFGNLNHITSFPTDLSPLKKLWQIRMYSLGDTFFKIPDSFFDLDIRIFRCSNVFDLSDPIASNLFKVNQWENLEALELASSSINNYFPNDWLIFKDSLNNIRLTSNNYSSFPSILEDFTIVNTFYFSIRDPNDIRQDWFDMSLWKRLSLLWVTGDVKIDTIDVAWKPLIRLSRIINMQTWMTESEFDTFIIKFYTLCTSEGFIDPSIPQAQQLEKPDRFRDINWGHSTWGFTGTKQAPSGFQLGVSNGNAQTPGEMIYVLQNNYGHLISHA